MADMSDGTHNRNQKRWIVLALVVIGIVVVAGFVLLSAYFTQECPPLVGCGPYPTLAIQGAKAQVGSYGPTICQTTAFTAVCSVYIVGGDSGKVMVNITFQRVQPGTYVGGASVAFLVYSSAAHYVNFTSIPTCAYISGPSLDAEGCRVPSNGEAEFQFAFSVSPSYGASNQRWPDSVTVTMWQTCCFP
jgi:hypothetical protein